MTSSLRAQPKRLRGPEPAGPGQIQDFWQWAFSDVNSNTLRGVYAEWLVAMATGTADGVREEWAPHDITVGGLNVEVKSAAFFQTWKQDKPSRIVFSIAPTKAWNPDTGTYEGPVRRQADVYVFCLLGDQVSGKADPRDLSQWKFFVLPTKMLKRIPKQKTIGLSSLRGLDPKRSWVTFEGLASAIAAAGVAR